MPSAELSRDWAASPSLTSSTPRSELPNVTGTTTVGDVGSVSSGGGKASGRCRVPSSRSAPGSSPSQAASASETATRAAMPSSLMREPARPTTIGFCVSRSTTITAPITTSPLRSVHCSICTAHAYGSSLPSW